LDVACANFDINQGIPARLLEQPPAGWERVFPARLHAQQEIPGGGRRRREVGFVCSVTEL